MRHVHFQAVRPPDDGRPDDATEVERPGRQVRTLSQRRRHQEDEADEGAL